MKFRFERTDDSIFDDREGTQGLPVPLGIRNCVGCGPGTSDAISLSVQYKQYRMAFFGVFPAFPWNVGRCSTISARRHHTQHNNTSAIRNNAPWCEMITTACQNGHFPDRSSYCSTQRKRRHPPDHFAHQCWLNARAFALFWSLACLDLGQGAGCAERGFGVEAMQPRPIST